MERKRSVNHDQMCAISFEKALMSRNRLAGYTLDANCAMAEDVLDHIFHRPSVNVWPRNQRSSKIKVSGWPKPVDQCLF